MCGIFGYIGSEEAVPILLKGLKRLEYRGYDSAGIALIDKNLVITKVKGNLNLLGEKLKLETHKSNIGIAHTRWATHGVPNEINAHPHVNELKTISIVHNGIIENYKTIKQYLQKKGYNFSTDTDSEVLVHLIDYNYKLNSNNLVNAVKKSLLMIEGTYGLAVLSIYEPEKIIVAKKGSPVIIGKSDKNEFFIASDVSAVIEYTKNITFLKDGEIAVLDKKEIKIFNLNNEDCKDPKYEQVEMELEEIEKKGFEHFMLKEIYEQDKTLLNSLRGRINTETGNVTLGGLTDKLETLKHAKRIILIACGTSWHSALIGEYLLESIAGIPTEVEYASEFRYRNPIIEEGTVVFVISQSGETADTLAALRESKNQSATVFGICNVVGSSIARQTDAGVYIHAGPEIGVASTKAFTSQVIVLVLIAILLGRQRNLSEEEGKKLVKELKNIPKKIESALKYLDEKSIKRITKLFANTNNALFLGRGINYPVALEGALKVKEISYIHAEGYPAAEMKHGPIALIAENMPCIVIATEDSMYNKLLSNIEEIKARKGKIIVIATEGDERIKELATEVIYVPKTLSLLSPIINVIPLQLLAYYLAKERGCSIDKPRNLAKSVTVE